MRIDLQYTIINAQLVSTETPMTIDGEDVIVTRQRFIVEASPVSGDDKTLSLSLMPDAADHFAEGSEITVTIDTGEG